MAMTSSTITSSRDRLEAALARIADPAGEGARTCLTVYAERARAEADAADARAKAEITLGPLDGVIVSIKDLFDVAGEPTRAGSKVCADDPPATRDAAIVRRLRAAGTVIVAKTNMTEFAITGIGHNPHYGTPANPFDRTRAPGGSSSGAGVAAADNFCDIAIGSDTGGSVRIPAALCGVVGFKPSRQRVPTEGAFPLSFTLDSIGPLARSVAACALADAVMAGEEPQPLTPAPIAGLRIGVVQGMPLEGLDRVVGEAFQGAITRLSRAGANVSDVVVPFFDEMNAANKTGGIIPAEAYSVLRERLATRADEFDPNSRARIERGGRLSAADYVSIVQMRRRLIAVMDSLMSDYDAFISPTVPIVAPELAAAATRETYSAVNAVLLRNTPMANFLDLCAISVPARFHAGLPAGVMLLARNGEDRRLFRIAAALETLVRA